MQGLEVGLQRLGRKQRRPVAAAFDEADARRHRIPGERIEGKHQWPLDEAVDHQPVLVRINVGSAAMRHDEMQPVRGDRTVQQVMRRACALVSGKPVWVVQAAHDVLLEARGPLVGLDRRPRLQAPRRIGQGAARRRFGGGARHRAERRGANRAGEDSAAAEHHATIQQAVAGHRFTRWIFRAAATIVGSAHVFLPAGRAWGTLFPFKAAFPGSPAI